MASFERPWQGRAHDDGSIHVLGNGRLCAYGQGPDLNQLIGPPYSGPQWGSLAVVEEAGLSCRSRREPGTAIWVHTLEDSRGPLAEFTDLVDSDLPCFVRRCVCRRPFRLRYRADGPQVRINDSAVTQGRGASCSRTLRMQRGQPYYSTYPFPGHGHAALIAVGPVSMQDEDDASVLVRLGLGESTLLFAASPDWPAQTAVAEEMLRTPWPEVLRRTEAAWQAFTAHRRPLPPVPKGIDAARLTWIADSVAVLIKAQQGSDGGIMGGYPFHMAYIRDQYGTSRGLLDLGHRNEARAILEFFLGVWSRRGEIHTAQPIGFDGPFHVHEEDRSEITGYLINQAFDWLDATKDESLVERCQPMLDWALDAQLSCLVDGTLPFNGDETYIAGGLFPRAFIAHGSAEATLLFIESGRRFRDWAQRRGRWSTERLAAVHTALEDSARRFRGHFLEGGVLWANEPSRAAHGPRFRHGVCQTSGCYRGQLNWLQRDANGNYLCPECFPRCPLPKVEPRRAFLASVALAPLFVGLGPLDWDEVRRQVEAVANRWLATGRLPSQADESLGGSGTVGYDYGLLLMGLDRLGHPSATSFAAQTLGLVDQTGSWVEFYVDGKGSSTRCRPWESAINLCAILKHSRRVTAGS
jgi:hypothetical protein